MTQKKFKLKAGDTVVVLTGKDKGKTGTISFMDYKKDRAVVAELNIAHRRQKPTQQDPGQIVKKELPIHISNLAFWDEKNSKGVRVGYDVQDGKKVRVMKGSNTVIA